MIPPSVQQSAIVGALVSYGGMILSAGHTVNSSPESPFLASLQNSAHTLMQGYQNTLQGLDAFQSAPDILQTAMMSGGPMACGMIGAGAASALAMVMVRKCDFGNLWNSCTEAIKNLFREDPGFAEEAKKIDEVGPAAYANDKSEMYFAYDPSQGKFQHIDHDFYAELEEYASSIGEKINIVCVSNFGAEDASYQMNIGGTVTDGSIKISSVGLELVDDVKAALLEERSRQQPTANKEPSIAHERDTSSFDFA
ncbi:hypothetical protein SAMN02744133_1085 [Thalassospira xiamenensis M-5 = DSM 17429]|uniref:Uncharacterized protein n=2 Tax=Thalassospira xiamenensis TaxID=220697 RepID=A0AB72UIL5_9PROT|nr:hypothetical protein TH3_21068 [Thalassospira xiamenensis M-5 = DSM 17429]SIT20796.1 hypothetical protein SAMN02744133_1085 [Thalassospira xiamenensis M-5 = DSM 17429]